MKRALEYPLKIFKNNTVLRLVIHSVWIRFLLLTIAFGLNYYDERLFNEYETIYTFVKAVFNTLFVLMVLGYFISKYSFCMLSIVSFYGIFLIRVNHFVNISYEYKYYNEAQILIIGLAWIIILIDFIKTKLVPLTKNVLLNKNTKDDITNTG